MNYYFKQITNMLSYSLITTMEYFKTGGHEGSITSDQTTTWRPHENDHI